MNCSWVFNGSRMVCSRDCCDNHSAPTERPITRLFAECQCSPFPGRRIFNFAKALTMHLGDGMRTRTQAEITEIFETHCKPCEFFDGKYCNKCARCNVNGEEKFWNKIKMKSETCPIGKWK